MNFYYCLSGILLIFLFLYAIPDLIELFVLLFGTPNGPGEDR